MAHKLADALAGGTDGAALLAAAAGTFRTYAAELNGLASRVDGSFARAVGMILAAEGRVIVSGMGKSGRSWREGGGDLRRRRRFRSA